MTRFGYFNAAQRVRRSPPEKRTRDGVVYASVHEARCAAWLEVLVRARVLWGWWRPGPFKLTASTSYRPDFQVRATELHPEFGPVLKDERGSATPGTLLEVKGAWTQASRLRVRLFCDLHPTRDFYVIPSAAFSATRAPSWPLPDEWRATATLARGGWARALLAARSGARGTPVVRRAPPAS